MKKVLAALLLAAMLTMMLAPAFAVSTYYSACRNGKPLNVREYPTKDSAKLGSIKYGDVVGVDHISNGWAMIVWGSRDAYVQANLLSKQYPGTKPPKTSGNTGSSASYKNFVFTDYTAVVTPSRNTGSVVVYWNPNTSGSKMGILHNDDIVRVLAQTNTWAQVYCEDTNMCGFVLKKYIVKGNN